MTLSLCRFAQQRNSASLSVGGILGSFLLWILAGFILYMAATGLLDTHATLLAGKTTCKKAAEPESLAPAAKAAHKGDVLKASAVLAAKPLFMPRAPDWPLPVLNGPVGHLQARHLNLQRAPPVAVL